MARGRKVNSNGERSKQLLLEKAIELFSTHGYHETKISDIVKAANLTQPTFYLYFQSKDKLFFDLNDQFKDSLLTIFTEKINDLKEGKITTRQLTKECIEHAFRYFYNNPKLTKIGFYEAQSANDLKNEIIELFVTALKDEDNIHNGIDLEILAYSLLGSVERLTLKYILTNQLTPEKLTNDILNLYFKEQHKTLTI